MLHEIEPCPKCGALPCDWSDNPHTATPDLSEERARRVLAEATGLALCDLRPERDDERVLQGSAIRAMIAYARGEG